MSVVSKLTFVPFTPDSIESTSRVYHSGRNLYRGELRAGLNSMFALAAEIVGMGLPYSKENYARIVVWCLRLLLDGWPAHIPFMNLSDIKGGIAPLRELRDLLHDGTLRFIPAPPDVRERALHDPESVLPHVIAAAKLPPLPLTIPVLKFSLRPPNAHIPPALIPAPAEERVLDPRTLEPVLTAPLGPDSTSQPHERRQRCDVNKARHRPVSNPEGKPMRARKIGALTSSYVLDPPARPSPGLALRSQIFLGCSRSGTSQPSARTRTTRSSRPSSDLGDFVHLSELSVRLVGSQFGTGTDDSDAPPPLVHSLCVALSCSPPQHQAVVCPALRALTLEWPRNMPKAEDLGVPAIIAMLSTRARFGHPIRRLVVQAVAIEFGLIRMPHLSEQLVALAAHVEEYEDSECVDADVHACPFEMRDVWNFVRGAEEYWAVDDKLRARYGPLWGSDYATAPP
ncbi:hypothetical protein GSI_10023 [Ganoderma sinense ZZ0214-1]|uniref:Uncharacterized protein n=1 Tax=Ganoderma sinense ZZ0214-1 TaxID=1077348 RepID=A0A2G8S2C1_9APHY|nr:hypothetical protein GSI_10023 [Ganoderma sinense ZZ0214-1]